MNLAESPHRISSVRVVPPPQFASRAPILTPVQRRGLTYQRKVEKELRQLGFSPKSEWIEYLDRGERRLARPDCWVHLPNREVALVECKLTYVSEGWDQLVKYRALLKALFADKTIRIVLACHNLVPDIPFQICSDWPAPDWSVWHWRMR